MPPTRKSKPLTPDLGALGRAIEGIIKEKQGMSANTVAKETGLSSKQVGRYVRGQGNPTYTMLIKLTEGLHVSLGELMGRVDVEREKGEPEPQSQKD